MANMRRTHGKGDERSVIATKQYLRECQKARQEFAI
jgi:hypothetical protein